MKEKDKQTVDKVNENFWRYFKDWVIDEGNKAMEEGLVDRESNFRRRS